MGAAAREAATFVVHGKADAFPGGIHHHFSFVTGILVHHFQHAHVGVGNGVVGIDPIVVGPAAEHFTVAGIGETHGVGHLHETVLVPVANEVAVLRHIAPDEGHQSSAALFGRFPPVGGFQGRRIPDKTGLPYQGFIGTGEKFLPAQAIEGDNHQTRVVIPLVAGYQRYQHQQGCSQKFFHRLSVL